MLTHSRFMLGVLACCVFGACAEPGPGTNLAAHGVLYFENIARPLDPVELQVGATANQICAWKEDPDDGHSGIDEDPPFYLTGYAVRSLQPSVATFAVAGPSGTAESACVTATVVAPGTATLEIDAADGSEVDHLDIPVLAAP